jgi:hypothetical protein
LARVSPATRVIENKSPEEVPDVGRTGRLDHAAFGNHLTVEMCQLLDQPDVLEQRRARDLTHQRRSIMADRIPPMTHATGSPVVDNTNILTAGRRGQQHKHASWA